MPTGNSEMGKIYYKIGGELKPMQIGDGITLEDCVEIVSDVDNALSNPKYFKGGEITFKMSRKEHKRMKKILQSVCPRYFTNNWRKMHHLPLIRRRGEEEMKLYEMIQNIRIFLIKLRIQIKLLPDEDFTKLLKDEKLDYTQRLYLIYFRYI